MVVYSDQKCYRFESRANDYQLLAESDVSALNYTSYAFVYICHFKDTARFGD